MSVPINRPRQFQEKTVAVSTMTVSGKDFGSLKKTAAVSINKPRQFQEKITVVSRKDRDGSNE
ncbi:MAG TPA: hypothetical protein VFM70_07075 [Salinimicrobium sp.]|nr:hypothetical protein [Salinimicrobium sp.]